MTGCFHVAADVAKRTRRLVILLHRRTETEPN
jgi:hypothetical protein